MKFGLRLSRGNGGWTVFNLDTAEIVGRYHKRADALFDRDGRNGTPRRKPNPADETQVRYYQSNLGGYQLYNSHTGHLLFRRVARRDARGLQKVLNSPLDPAVL